MSFLGNAGAVLVGGFTGLVIALVVLVVVRLVAVRLGEIAARRDQRMAAPARERISAIASEVGGKQGHDMIKTYYEYERAFGVRKAAEAMSRFDASWKGMP